MVVAVIRVTCSWEVTGFDIRQGNGYSDKRVVGFFIYSWRTS